MSGGGKRAGGVWRLQRMQSGIPKEFEAREQLRGSEEVVSVDATWPRTVVVFNTDWRCITDKGINTPYRRRV